MRTSSASSRRSTAVEPEEPAFSRARSAPPGEQTDDAAEPFWLPWHLDPNTISTLTGDVYFDFESSVTLTNFSYPAEGLGLVAMNSLGDVVHLSPHIDDSSMVVMMAAGAQMHTGGLLRGCLHAVRRDGAPDGYSRAMYYQAWYGPSDHRFLAPTAEEGAAATTADADAATVPAAAATAKNRTTPRVRSIVDPIVSSLHNRTSRTVLLDFRRQFQRQPVGSEADGSQERFERLVDALPPVAPAMPITIDVVTDLVCPIAYLGLKRLERALANLGWGEEVATVRFHPLLLNPTMPPEGEAMDSYLRRRRNLTLEE